MSKTDKCFCLIANSFPQAGIKKWGTDEETFIEVFTKRSFPQLKAMLPEYKKVETKRAVYSCHCLLVYLVVWSVGRFVD